MTLLAAIGDEEVARRVQRHARGTIEVGPGGRSTVAAVTQGAVARDRDDIAARLDHLADDVVALVGDEDVARRIHRHARG